MTIIERLNVHYIYHRDTKRTYIIVSEKEWNEYIRYQDAQVKGCAASLSPLGISTPYYKGCQLRVL